MTHFYTRRKEGLIDLAFDPADIRASGTDGYRIKHASNWDGSFSKLIDIPLWGERSSSVPNTYNPQNIHDRYVRYLFDPADHNFEDDKVHYFKVTSLDGNSEQNTSRMEIVLAPNQSQARRPVLSLSGNAPVAGDYDNGTHLVLPVTAVDFNLVNDGGNTIYLGFGSEGSEFSIGPGDSIGDNQLNVEEINLRTDQSANSPSSLRIYTVLGQAPSL
jgi:hypothetical protein